MNNKPQLKIDIWEAWKQYETVAMHFNDLIIKLRIQALGGVAALSTVAGVIAKVEHEVNFNWAILSISFLFLSVLWVAIWILDFGYYNKLLQGAVEEVLRIENLSTQSAMLDKIYLSSQITKAEQSGKYEYLKTRAGCVKYFSPRWGFYILVFVGLIGITILSFVKFLLA